MEESVSRLDDLSAVVVDGYLARLCRELGAPPARLDPHGEAHLTGTHRGREVTMSLALAGEQRVLTMRSGVGRLGDGDRAAASLALLLALNLSPADTAGAAFAVSPGDATAYLTHSLIGPTAGYDIFRSAFLRLFSLSALWQEQFERNPALAPG